MTESTFQPNWASAPGQTIQAIADLRGFTTEHLQISLSIHESEVNELLTGRLRISSDLAKRIASLLGSTPRFWLERDRHYYESLRALELAAPEISRWAKSFPVAEMVKAGWMAKPAAGELASELLDFFAVSSLMEWKENYQARHHQTKFRTSQSFENTLGSTTAWIRHGEIVAEEMDCGPFDKEGFRATLKELKTLTLMRIRASSSPCSRRSAESTVLRL